MSAVEGAPAGGGPGWARAFGYWMVQYRRTWRGSAVTSLLEPVGYLTAMGLGLGVLVRAGGQAGLGGLGYLQFVAPGVLAATAMQTAVVECTYPVMSAVKWTRAYHAMLATPLTTRDVLGGHLAFVAFRLVTTLTVFTVVMALFGTVTSPYGVLALPVAVLTGLAYATPVLAYAVHAEDDQGFSSLFRFVIVPMFLFSGTFFPLTSLPGWVATLVEVVPLWHGVDLSRALTTGRVDGWLAAGHVAYLAAWSAGGWWVARRAYQARLAP